MEHITKKSCCRAHLPLRNTHFLQILHESRLALYSWLTVVCCVNVLLFHVHLWNNSHKTQFLSILNLIAVRRKAEVWHILCSFKRLLSKCQAESRVEVSPPPYKYAYVLIVIKCVCNSTVYGKVWYMVSALGGDKGEANRLPHAHCLFFCCCGVKSSHRMQLHLSHTIFQTYLNILIEKIKWLSLVYAAGASEPHKK